MKPLRVDPEVAKLVDRASCAVGNGSHETAVLAPAKFDAAKALAEMKAEDRRRGCPGRDYSASKDSGVTAYEGFLTENAEHIADQCESSTEDPNVDELRALLRTLAADPANLGVFSSIHDDAKNDDPVHCAYFRFDVYRADGTVAKFDYDWSD